MNSVAEGKRAYTKRRLPYCQLKAFVWKKAVEMGIDLRTGKEDAYITVRMSVSTEEAALMPEDLTVYKRFGADFFEPTVNGLKVDGKKRRWMRIDNPNLSKNDLQREIKKLRSTVSQLKVRLKKSNDNVKRQKRYSAPDVSVSSRVVGKSLFIDKEIVKVERETRKIIPKNLFSFSDPEETSFGGVAYCRSFLSIINLRDQETMERAMISSPNIYVKYKGRFFYGGFVFRSFVILNRIKSLEEYLAKREAIPDERVRRMYAEDPGDVYIWGCLKQLILQ